MAWKTLFLLSLLLLAVALAVPLEQAQLGGLLGLINITGIVHCTDGSISTNSMAILVFPNAVVQLQCGIQKNVVSSATTNASGLFSILLDPITVFLSSLLNDCKLVVNTPLSTCNASLPSTGILQSAIRLLGGILGIVNLGAAGFSFLPGLPLEQA